MRTTLTSITINPPYSIADMMTVHDCIMYLNEFAHGEWEANTDAYGKNMGEVKNPVCHVFHNKGLIYSGTIEEIGLFLNHLTDIF